MRDDDRYVRIEMYPDGNHDEAQHEKDRREIANVNDYDLPKQISLK